jgi:DNA replicative helicase MCM subunit Mcm2 (Cdc46/Mcm family)
MGIRVRDLPSMREQQDSNEQNPFLYCGSCGSHYSATREDYFWMTEADEFECCEEPMRLVTMRTEFIDWKKPDARPVPVRDG